MWCLGPAQQYSASAYLVRPPSVHQLLVRYVVCRQVPLHMVFTMPWTPTKDYPHPFLAGMLQVRTITAQVACSTRSRPCAPTGAVRNCGSLSLT